MQREEFIVGRGGEEFAVGKHQFGSHQYRCNAADEKKERDRNEIEQCNSLVVVGEKPGAKCLLIVQIILPRSKT